MPSRRQAPGVSTVQAVPSSCLVLNPKGARRRAAGSGQRAATCRVRSGQPEGES